MGEGGSRRFRALDGWRGICALLIALHHFPARGFVYHLPLVRNSWLLVDFFFVLSGFVIAHAYSERLTHANQFKPFAIRRFFRLWPLHVCVLAAFIALTTSAKDMTEKDDKTDTTNKESIAFFMVKGWRTNI